MPEKENKINTYLVDVYRSKDGKLITGGVYSKQDRDKKYMTQGNGFIKTISFTV